MTNEINESEADAETKPITEADTGAVFFGLFFFFVMGVAMVIWPDALDYKDYPVYALKSIVFALLWNRPIGIVLVVLVAVCSFLIFLKSKTESTE